MWRSLVLPATAVLRVAQQSARPPAIRVGEEESQSAERNVEGGVSEGSEDSVGSWPRDLHVTFWSGIRLQSFFPYPENTSEVELRHGNILDSG